MPTRKFLLLQASADAAIQRSNEMEIKLSKSTKHPKEQNTALSKTKEKVLFLSSSATMECGLALKATQEKYKMKHQLTCWKELAIAEANKMKEQLVV